MAKRTQNLQLYVWDLRTDKWTHSELASNWDAIDARIWTGKNQFEILSAVPSTGNFAGRIVMLSAVDDDFPAWTVIRYDGTSWKTIGAIEVQAFLPITNNYTGRLVLLTQPNSGSPAWTLYVYNGSTWVDITLLNTEEAGTTVGARRRLNFISGTGIDINGVDNLDEGRIDLTLTSAAVSEIHVFKDGISVGTRKSIDLRDSQNVLFDIEDHPETSSTDITVNADIATVLSDIATMIGYTEWNPGSATTTSLAFTPVAQQVGTPAQSNLDNFYYSYAWTKEKTTSHQDRERDRYGQSRDDRFTTAYPQYTPTQAVTFQPLVKSTPWTLVNANLDVDFTVPNSGKVMIYLSAIANISATSPRKTVSSGSGQAYTYSVYDPVTSSIQSGLTYDQMAWMINQQMQNGVLPYNVPSVVSGSPTSANLQAAITAGQNTNATGVGGQNLPVSIGASGTGTFSGAFITPDPVSSSSKTVPIFEDLTDAQIIWGIKDGDYILPGTEVVVDSAGRTGYGSGYRTTVQLLVEGLTPGQSKTYSWWWRIHNPYERATAKSIFYAGGNYGPASMEVWSIV